MAAKRVAYLALGALLTAVALFEMAKHGGATWAAVAFVFLPDLALIFGAGSGLERGQLDPRAVRLYNALHSFVVPIALVIAGIWLPPVVFAGGLAWGAHIAWDRGLGFGTTHARRLPAAVGLSSRSERGHSSSILSMEALS